MMKMHTKNARGNVKLDVTKFFARPRGQFHQPYGAKRKCAGSQIFVSFSFTNKIILNFTNTYN